MRTVNRWLTLPVYWFRRTRLAGGVSCTGQGGSTDDDSPHGYSSVCTSAVPASWVQGGGEDDYGEGCSYYLGGCSPHVVPSIALSCTDSAGPVQRVWFQPTAL